MKCFKEAISLDSANADVSAKIRSKSQKDHQLIDPLVNSPGRAATACSPADAICADGLAPLAAREHVSRNHPPRALNV
jgi:hypothetical protein